MRALSLRPPTVERVTVQFILRPESAEMHEEYHRLIIYFDGASRNNPHGPAGCGWVIYEMDEHGAVGNAIADGSHSLGYNVSNNQAEYEGLEHALQWMYDNKISCDGLYVRGDSEIVINQLDGIYQVRSPNITGYYSAVMSLLNDIQYDFVSYRHVRRDQNSYADNLANQAISRVRR